jgi:GntR family transcriptional regulator
MKVDRNSHVPVYWQIKEDIHRQIMQGELQPGNQIPSEPKLAENYGVSRLTARNAVTELVNEGYLQRLHGQGTFVTKPRFEESAARFSGFHDTMVRKGYTVFSRVLAAEEVEADQLLQEKLKVPEGTAIYRIKRIRYAGKEPLGLQDVYLVASRCEGVLKIDLTSDSIYRFLVEEKLLNLRKAKEKLEATVAESDVAEALGIPVGSPVLYTHRITLITGDIPVEFSTSWYRGDSYVFEVEIS